MQDDLPWQEWVDLWRYQVHDAELEARAASLIARGVDPTREITPQWTPMGVLMSTRTGFGGDHPWSLIQLLLDKGVDINAPCGPNATPLLVAAGKQPATTLLQMVEAGAELPMDQPFAAVALRNPHDDALEALLSAGANPDVKDPQGVPALHRAIERGNWDFAQALVDRGANLAAWGPLRSSALCELCKKSGMQIIPLVKQILKMGADPNETDLLGRTPLLYLCAASMSATLSLAWDMVAAGADPRIRDRDGRAPLDVLVEQGGKSVGEFLRETIIRLDVEDIAAATPPACGKTPSRRI